MIYEAIEHERDMELYRSKGLFLQKYNTLVQVML